MTQHTLELPDVDLVYDVFGPLPTADGRPPLVMIGQPMDASGFQAQVKLFEDRTVVTYDPRGLGRSRRKDGGVTNEPETQAEDVHAIIEALGAGPVEMLASSGGAVTALALVTAYPRRRVDAGRARAADRLRAAGCGGCPAGPGGLHPGVSGQGLGRRNGCVHRDDFVGGRGHG